MILSVFFRLKDLQARDEAKAANERAKNMLETHIFDMREKLFSDEGVLLSTQEEREKIDQALNEASDWLDDEGWDSTADVSSKPLLLQHFNPPSTLFPGPLSLSALVAFLDDKGSKSAGRGREGRKSLETRLLLLPFSMV